MDESELFDLSQGLKRFARHGNFEAMHGMAGLDLDVNSGLTQPSIALRRDNCDYLFPWNMCSSTSHASQESEYWSQFNSMGRTTSSSYASLDSGYGSTFQVMPRTTSDTYHALDSGHSSILSPAIDRCEGPSSEISCRPSSNSTSDLQLSEHIGKESFRCHQGDCLPLMPVFYSKIELQRHLREQHKISQFNCHVPGCERQNSRGYLRECDLRKHMKTKHELHSVAQQVQDRSFSAEQASESQSGLKQDEECSLTASQQLQQLDNLPTSEDMEYSESADLPESLASRYESSTPIDDQTASDSSLCSPKDMDLLSEDASEDSSQTSIEPLSTTSSRAPSPWQNLSDLPPHQERRIAEHLAESLARIRNSSSWDYVFESSTATNFGSPHSSENIEPSSWKSSPKTSAGSENNAPSPEKGTKSLTSHFSSAGASRSQYNISSKRSRGGADEGEDRGDEPPPKQVKSFHDNSQLALNPIRLACPYNKWDPRGCPYCCRPWTKNPTGGASSFSRLKSHMFRNHDLSIRCKSCWRSFQKPQALKDHENQKNCVRRKCPTKYWMTEEQRQKIRSQRFVGTDEENWYNLFETVLPDVPLDGPTGRYITPYYVAVFSESPSSYSPQDQENGNSIVGDFSIIQPSAAQTDNTGSFINTTGYSASSPSMYLDCPDFQFLTGLPNFEGNNVSTLGQVQSSPDTSTVQPPRLEDSGPLTIQPIQAQTNIPTAPTLNDSSQTSESNTRSLQFLQLNAERLGRDIHQLREASNDWHQRAEMARNHLGSLESLLEVVLSHTGLPVEVWSSLFEASEILTQIRRELK